MPSSFKSLIAFAASIGIAFPVQVVAARSVRRPAAVEPAESTFVPDDPMPVAAPQPTKIPRKKNSGRGPASLATLKSSEAPATPSKRSTSSKVIHGGAPPFRKNVKQSNFSIKGKPFVLTQKFNARGAMIEQVLMSNDRAEISIDRKGKGSLDTWDLITPGRTVSLREPTRGRFRIMEVEEITKVAVLNMKFLLTKEGDYRLYEVRPRANKPMFQTSTTDFVVGCRASEQHLSDIAAIVNEAVSADDEVLQSALKKIMQPSCSKAPFDTQRDLMLAGMSDVFKSDSLWNVARKNEYTSKALKSADKASVPQHGLYLQCLRYYQLDTHASRIASAPMTYMTKLNEANGLTENFAWKVECESIDSNAGLKTCNDVSPAAMNECNAAGTKSRGINGEIIQPAGAPPTISFVSDTGGKKNTSKEDYARTFFHEMLHYSLISDEWATDEIESCCSQPDAGTKECKALEKRLASKKYAQAFENQVSDALGNQYLNYRNMVRDSFGSSGDQVVDNFYGKVGETYIKYGQGPLKCTFKKDDPNLAACEKAFNADVSKYVEQYFGENDNSDCRKTTADNMGEDASKAFCKQLAGYTRVLTGLDPANLGKGFCPAGHVEFRSPLYYLPFIEQEARAEDVASELCDLSRATKSAAARITYVPGADAPAIVKTFQNTESTDGANEQSGKSESAKTIDHASTGTRGGYESSGPSRPDYSGSSTDRAYKIERDLAREDNVVGKQLGALVDRIVKPLLPEAAAQEQEKYSRLQAHVPNESVADPLRSSVAASAAAAAGSVQVNGNLSDGLGGGSPVAGRASVSGDRGLANVPGAGAVGPGGATGAGGTSGFASGSATGAATSATFGASANGGKAQGQDPTKTPKPSASDERALRALLVYLQRPYSTVRPELERPSVITSLKRHFVQVVDSEGQVFGSGYPKHKLLYDETKQRLIEKPGTPE